MRFSLRHLGSYGGNPATILELIIEADSTVITEDVTDMSGRVSDGLIANIRDIANELEGHNELIDEREPSTPNPKT